MVILMSGCQGFCGEEDYSKKIPRVTVANSTFLRVSWHSLFKGCKVLDDDQLFAIVEPVGDQNATTQKLFPLKLEDKEGFLSLNPCLEYKIYLGIMTNDRVTKRDSGSVMYNDISRQNIVSLYGGFLLDENYTDNVCLKEKGVITFPDPPEALSDCILTSGDQMAEEFTAPGQSHQVPIKIRHPRKENELIFTADVNKIKQCAPNTTLENTEEPTPSNKDQDPAPKSAKHAMIYIVGISGTLLVAGLVTSVVCCIKKKENRTPIGQSYDVNPVYGTVYYYQDRCSFLK